MHFRFLSPEEGNKVCDWADANNIDYDWWNIAEVVTSDKNIDWEIGMSRKNWALYDAFQETIGSQL